jgi:hypothetical protein
MILLEYQVVLTDVERKKLITIALKGSSKVKRIMYPQVLQFTDENNLSAFLDRLAHYKADTSFPGYSKEKN